MKKWLDRGLTGFAVLFSIPTILILISWNAIPGDRLYKIKAALEDVALAITVKTPIAQALSLEFTDRRFDEATKLLAKEGSSVGYDLVVAEAQQTESLVLAKADVKNGSQLIENIEQYQAKIDQQKEAIEAKSSLPQAPTTQPTSTIPPIPTRPPVATPLATTKETTTKTITINKPVQVVIQEENPDQIVANLEQTKQELETIKERVKKELPESAKQSGHEVKLKDASQKDRKDAIIQSDHGQDQENNPGNNASDSRSEQ